MMSMPLPINWYVGWSMILAAFVSGAIVGIGFHREAGHADYVIVGEGENVWPAVVEAALVDDPPRIFDSAEFPPVDIAALPVPRYDLLDGERPYNRFTVQSSRGCPWRCDFCASTVMLGRRYRKRPVEHVVRDIRAIEQLHRHPFIEFADDNTFVDKQWARNCAGGLLPCGSNGLRKRTSPWPTIRSFCR